MSRGNYQDVLAKVRAWVAENGDQQFDVWAPRWQLADAVPDAWVGRPGSRSQLADTYCQQVLRALYVLVDEGVLVKVGERNDARYMTPAVRDRQVQAAREAGERHAAQVLRWRNARDGLARAGFLSVSTSQLDIRLPLEEWERLISQYLDDGGN